MQAFSLQGKSLYQEPHAHFQDDLLGTAPLFIISQRVQGCYLHIQQVGLPVLKIACSHTYAPYKLADKAM